MRDERREGVESKCMMRFKAPHVINKLHICLFGPKTCVSNGYCYSNLHKRCVYRVLKVLGDALECLNVHMHMYTERDKAKDVCI